MRKRNTIVTAYLRIESTVATMRRDLWNDIRGLDPDEIDTMRDEISAEIRENGFSPKRFQNDLRIARTMGPIVDEAEIEDGRTWSDQMVSAVNALGGGVDAYLEILESDETPEAIAKAARGNAETPLQRAKRIAADLAKVLPSLTPKQRAAILASLTA